MDDFKAATNELLIYQFVGLVVASLDDNGYREIGFDSGDGALEMATTSTEGSRSVNYPIPMRRGSDMK